MLYLPEICLCTVDVSPRARRSGTSDSSKDLTWPSESKTTYGLIRPPAEVSLKPRPALHTRVSFPAGRKALSTSSDPDRFPSRYSSSFCSCARRQALTDGGPKQHILQPPLLHVLPSIEGRGDEVIAPCQRVQAPWRQTSYCKVVWRRGHRLQHAHRSRPKLCVRTDILTLNPADEGSVDPTRTLRLALNEPGGGGARLLSVLLAVHRNL